MTSARKVDNEIRVAVAWVVVAGVGWWLRSIPLAIVGLLGTATAVAMYVWQRECLVAVTYIRKLGQTRAMFDERIDLDIEVVNDKLLPLAWFRIDDDVPAALDIEGATVVPGRAGIDTLIQLFPMLPYQRIRRHLTIVCSRRGEYTFGPAILSSGDPIGLRKRSVGVPGLHRLLVYPKVFTLAPAGIASRVLIGDERARFEFIDDPSRVAGVREYRRGDPLRYVDWRATARSAELLVRQFEPSVALRVAVFVDLRASRLRLYSLDEPELEFAVSVTASIVSDLAQRKIATGLFASGTAAGMPLAYPPSTSPSMLPIMLEALAKVSSTGIVHFSEVLEAASGTLQQGTSIVTVATEFPEATLIALGELRRRHAVTAVWIASEQGTPPPHEAVDALLVARYSDDWQQREVLDLTS